MYDDSNRQLLICDVITVTSFYASQLTSDSYPKKGQHGNSIGGFAGMSPLLNQFIFLAFITQGLVVGFWPETNWALNDELAS